MSRPVVSVILPVYNDAARLRTCLQRLTQQTFARDETEILVVDNGSTDDVAAVVAEFPAVRLLHEATPGSYAARNRALSVAHGELLAFTDADCLPEPDWLERGIRRLRADDQPALVGGRVELFPRRPGKPNPAEVFSMAYELRQDRWLERFGYAATANLFTRRAVLDHVGRFDATKKSAGDAEWGARVKASGGLLAYEPGAVVRHPARQWQDIRNKAKRNMGGISGEAYRRLRLGWLIGQGLLAVLTPLASLRRLPRGWQVARLRGAAGIYVAGVYVDCIRLVEFVRLRLGASATR